MARMAPFAIVYAVIVTLIVLAIVFSPLVTRRLAVAHEALVGVTVNDTDVLRTGLIVTSVRTDGEAAQAGIRTGDNIIAIDHQRVLSRRDAAHLLRRHRGQSVVVDIARNGHRSRVWLKLAGGRPHGA